MPAAYHQGHFNPLGLVGLLALKPFTSVHYFGDEGEAKID
jgi:hypothetical protein